jgi:hypothetical protein
MSDINPIKGAQPTPTPPILQPECIVARKVYDWIFDQNTYENKITLPEACQAAIISRLQAGHRLTVRCNSTPPTPPFPLPTFPPTPPVFPTAFPTPTPSPLPTLFPCPGAFCEFDATLATDGFCNGVPVKIVPFQFTACITLDILDLTQGDVVCAAVPVVVTFPEDIALCLPEPLGNQNILCAILDVVCSAQLVPFDQSVLLRVTICKEIQVEAEVKLEIMAAFCTPRGFCPTSTPTPPTCPPFPSFPPQCRGLFPPV